MKRFAKNSNYDKYYKGLVPILKKEDNQKYFMIILSISASIFFLIFAIKPTATTIANLRKQITDATQVEQMLDQKVKNISSLMGEYQTLQSDLPLILDAVPETPQAPTLIGQVQSLAQDSSILITNIEVQTVGLNSTNATQSSSFTFSVSGTSSPENMQKFIDDLIGMQRAISINGIQTTRNSTTNNVDFIIKAKAYFKK